MQYLIQEDYIHFLYSLVILFFKKLKIFLRESYWVIPIILGLMGMTLALTMLYVDKYYNIETWLNWFPTTTQQNILTPIGIIIAAMVTLSGFLFPMISSILLKVTDQFTPIVLTSYQSKWSPKFFIGLLFSTILYLMTLLFCLTYVLLDTNTPFTVLIGFLLVIISIYSVPKFFDQLAKSIKPSNLIAQIQSDFMKLLPLVFSKETQIDSYNQEIQQDRKFLNAKLYKSHINSPFKGYISSIDKQALVKLANEQDVLIAINLRSGDFILKNSPLLYINKDNLNQQFISKLLSCFSVKDMRIGISDLELQLNVIQNITLHALSPGINDFSTARECIDQIGSMCNSILNQSFNKGVYKDKNQIIRLYSKEFDFQGFVNASFDLLRQCSSPYIEITFHLLRIIQNLIKNCNSKERKNYLKKIANKILQESQNSPIKDDKDLIISMIKSIYSL